MRNGSFRRTGVTKPKESFRPVSHGAGADPSSTDVYNDPEGQAYAMGYREGVKAGMSSERKKVQLEVENLRNIIMHLEGIRPQAYRGCEREIVALAAAIAKKILKYEVSRNREVIKTVVEEAVKKADGSSSITVRVSPDDYQLFRSEEYRVPGLVDPLHTVAFEEDITLHSGDCVVETNLGDIDARIEKQLQSVEEAFKAQV
ncbi:MAG: FliH/SctL family protein [Thermodesulfobacteriota bacterium]|nr:FliH/SctL family protein [Thermodesulfobacteriota bacterium]